MLLLMLEIVSGTIWVLFFISNASIAPKLLVICIKHDGQENEQFLLWFDLHIRPIKLIFRFSLIPARPSEIALPRCFLF